MPLGLSLTFVFAAFLAILVTVIAMSFRERRLARIAASDAKADAASDARVMAIVFAAIPGGMLLTVITAWLVFF
jgi:hypothetical protein